MRGAQREGIGAVVGTAKRQMIGTTVEEGTGVVTRPRKSGTLAGPQQLVSKEHQLSPPWGGVRIWPSCGK